MPCLFAAFAICHRSHSPLCSLFQISKATKIQVKIAQLILSPLLNGGVCENDLYNVWYQFGCQIERKSLTLHHNQ